MFDSPAVVCGDARGVDPWSNRHDTMETNVSGNLIMESATHVEQKKNTIAGRAANSFSNISTVRVLNKTCAAAERDIDGSRRRSRRRGKG